MGQNKMSDRLPLVTLTVPVSQLDSLTQAEAQRIVTRIDEEREENATPGDPGACGEGFRYNGPSRAFVTSVRTLDDKVIQALVQIARVSNTGDVAIEYNVYGIVH